MSYKSEFSRDMHPSEYELEQLFEVFPYDNSWHNDVSPSFHSIAAPDGTYYTLWADAPDPRDREHNQGRWLVMQYDEEATPISDDPDYVGDSLQEALECALELIEAALIGTCGDCGATGPANTTCNSCGRGYLSAKVKPL